MRALNVNTVMKTSLNFGFVILGVLLLTGMGCNPTTTETDSMNGHESSSPAVTQPAVEEDAEDSEMEEEEDSQEVSEDASVQAGSYEPYAESKLALADSGDVVLFFNADWCPSCRALDSDIEDSLEDIPDGVTILSTDYDEHTDLKKKYGVTTQHTFVQVDADGNEIAQWSGGSTLEDVLENIE